MWLTSVGRVKLFFIPDIWHCRDDTAIQACDIPVIQTPCWWSCRRRRQTTRGQSQPPSFENDLQRRVGQESGQAHVRNLAMIVVLFLINSGSWEALNTMRARVDAYQGNTYSVPYPTRFVFGCHPAPRPCPLASTPCPASPFNVYRLDATFSVPALQNGRL